MPLTGLEPPVPASKRPQTLALNHVATEICTHVCLSMIYALCFVAVINLTSGPSSSLVCSFSLVAVCVSYDLHHSYSF